MQQRRDYFTSKSTFIGLAIILFLMLCAAYSNHFKNDFQFDDIHTIVHNDYIRKIKNLPLFFTDIKYFGTNLNNQAYRPIVVSLNTIDYWLAGDLNPVYFHADIFVSYIALLVLLFFFYKSIFQKSGEPGAVNRENSLVALMATGFFGLHAANAETINYIIQRADSLSTFFIIASLLLYINPKTRKYYLYLISIALAIVTKEVAITAAVLIFFYILLFEENTSFTQLFIFKKNNPAHKGLLRALKKSLPALIFTYFFFSKMEAWFMMGHSTASAQEAPPALNYYATEAVVFVHYLANFLLPVNLSISSGYTIYPSVNNPKIFFSFLLILTLVVIAFVASGKKEQRPIAFGVVWFFVALVPSSFVVKDGELSNDHRTFFPYIGLVMALAWWLRLLYFRYQLKRKESGADSRKLALMPSKNKIVKGRPASNQVSNTYNYLPKIIAFCYFVIISFHAYGTYKRNIVWSSYGNLWHDALLKNPNDYMALMNYGLQLMNDGKYEETLSCFEKVLKIKPEWAYINVNMGVLKERMDKPLEAEEYFRNAIRVQPFYPVGYLTYARFLLKYGKEEEAIAQLEQGLKVSPGDADIIELLNSTKKSQTPEAKLKELNEMARIAAQNPTEDNYLNLSMVYYKNRMAKESIEACEKALKLNPASAIAYSNICGCYNALGQWAKAEEACKKALQIDSTLQLAKNSLITAQKHAEMKPLPHCLNYSSYPYKSFTFGLKSVDFNIPEHHTLYLFNQSFHIYRD